MAYLGRPSGGDSPFAIGDRAMRDTSSPQPPSQRNPTPRQPNNMGPPQQQGGFMDTPSPYGSASDEARRRYEERYAKKRAEDAAKAQAELQPSAPPPPPQQQQQYSQPPPQQGLPGAYGQPQQQYSQPPPPPRQQYTSPPPQQSGFDPRQQQYQSGQQPQQGPPGGYGQRPQSLGRPPQGYTSPPPQQYQQGGPPPPPAPQQQQQRPPSQRQRWSQQSQNQSQNQYGQYNQPPPPPPQQQQQWQQQSHHPQQVQASPPMGADDAELHRMFVQFDSSRSGDLSTTDLQRLLAKDTMMDAREDAVKMLTKLFITDIFDTDKSGTINFQEFEGLYRYIQDWHGIFRRFDRDNSGTIDRKELHNALLGFGFSLPKEMVISLEKRFAPPPKAGQAPTKGISFDRFLMACVTVKHYTEGFRRLDINGSGHITIDYNQFMELVLDAPS
uniref:Calcium-binding protein n=1 Tax=Kwoniella pini CBS 10737 TaxID=1296096 RepID=A0A1B9I1W2_9TREE|nr:calcium-binding protein [Kwoniella pini CBS 10737]OCF49485.1 calcium-binding protein [Kwoniella pini CBS 10737]